MSIATHLCLCLSYLTQLCWKQPRFILGIIKGVPENLVLAWWLELMVVSSHTQVRIARYVFESNRALSA